VTLQPGPKTSRIAVGHHARHTAADRVARVFGIRS